MSEPWWTLAAGLDRIPRLQAGPDPTAASPEIAPGGRGSVRQFIAQRIPSYTPDWARQDARDAGVALVRLFGSLTEPVLERVNRLPEKFLVEHLRLAGVERLPATAAAALLEFTVSPAAGGYVRVPPGFQAGAEPAGGSGDQVIFETVDEVVATSARIADIRTQVSGLVDRIDPEAERTFQPFGASPPPGATLSIGLTPEGDPPPSLSIGIRLAAPADAPLPVSAGGLRPLPQLPPPVLRWEVLDAGQPVAVSVRADQTDALQRSGVIRLDLPRSWRPFDPSSPQGRSPLRWLRATLIQGTYDRPPSIEDIRLNMVQAVAARTVRDELLEPVPEATVGTRTVMRVSQTPVLPGSVVVQVDEGGEPDVFGIGAPAGAPGERTTEWQEVGDLSSQDANERVFTLDPTSGELTFGDGVHGARIPEGFRNVRAARYRVGGGSMGAVGAEAVSSPVTSVPFVTAVTNPFPASGGVDAESDTAARRRGTEELRTRERSVTEADYALMARRAPGADVARAHAVAGFHPDFPGLPIPGVVTVFVVPSERGIGPPIPGEQALRAVAEYLRDEVSPVGVEVVATAPRFHRVRVEATVVMDPNRDIASALRAASETLDSYLDPLRGGDSGTGWPFGGSLLYMATLRRLLAGVPDIEAVSQLDFVVDGVRLAICADFATLPNALLWPVGHDINPLPLGRKATP